MADHWVWPPAVFCLTVLLQVAAFPPFKLPESAYIFAAPLILWAYYKPALKRYLITVFLSGTISWLILISWLRHVTYAGTLALALYLGLFFLLWGAAVRWVIPQTEKRRFLVRISALLGLAGLWVLLEYLRGYLFTGFPWLPLAASQWDRSTLLQILSYTGYGGLSFVLIFFNLGLAAYLRRLIKRRRYRDWYERICPEFYFALLLLLGAASGLIWAKTFNQSKEKLFTAAVVQPYIKPSLKWDSERVSQNFRILEKQTYFASLNGGEVIFWPESVTPLPIKGNREARLWTEDLVRKIDKPVVMGNMAREGERWYNIVCAVSPREGLIEPYYAKRKLVPFGEYVPLRKIFPFLRKIVPIDGSFGRGGKAEVIPVKIGNSIYEVGALVCYEDIFPGLSRDMAKAGADFLFVATNDAWYGEEGGAYQHAAHSVLRAVETRRPVIRCGNGGWSGWIDEYGNVRKILMMPDKGIYFRGSDLIKVSRDRRWTHGMSFYVRYGDWFASVCAFFVIWGYVSLRTLRGEPYRPGQLLRPQKAV